jgi:hypothetical protein
MVSKEAIRIKSGAVVSFDWYASGDIDDYDVFAYILDVRNQGAVATQCTYWYALQMG